MAKRLEVAFTKHTTWDEGLALSRGGIPTSIWRNKATQKRFRTAAPPPGSRRCGTAVASSPPRPGAPRVARNPTADGLVG